MSQHACRSTHSCRAVTCAAAIVARRRRTRSHRCRRFASCACCPCNPSRPALPCPQRRRRRSRLLDARADERRQGVVAVVGRLPIRPARGTSPRQECLPPPCGDAGQRGERRSLAARRTWCRRRPGQDGGLSRAHRHRVHHRHRASLEQAGCTRRARGTLQRADRRGTGGDQGAAASSPMRSAGAVPCGRGINGFRAGSCTERCASMSP